MSSESTGAMGEESKEKPALVPRLRFQTFLSEQVWIPRRLGEIARFTSGGTPSKDEPSYWNGNIPWISASSMYETRIADSELRVTTSAIGNGTRIAPKGSLLVLVRGSMLFNRVPIGVAAIDVAFNQDVKALSIQGDANTNFLLYQLIAASGRIPVNETGIGAGKIETDVLAGLPICLPSPTEQQKIADCLSSLDELITAETQKLDALKTHKKCLMQQLFPREGETVPRLRFPEFRSTGAWSKVVAGQLFSNRIERGRSDLPIYSVTMTDGLVLRASLDRKVDDIADASANKAARAGDLAYNMMRMWQGALGIAPEDCMVSPAYIVLEPQGVNPYFFYYLLKQPQSLRVLTAHSRGLTEDRLRLYYDDFAKVTLQCPSLPEQDRISDCLISADKVITTQNQKIDALKTHKKGLMQQLFPVLDEAPA